MLRRYLNEAIWFIFHPHRLSLKIHLERVSIVNGNVQLFISLFFLSFLHIT
jgi:hypothetical protein